MSKFVRRGKAMAIVSTKTSSRDKKVTLPQLSKKVRRIQRRQSQNRPEPKFFEVFAANQLMGNLGTATAIDLSKINQGDTDETRDGAQITAYSLIVKLFTDHLVVGDQSGTNANWNCRIIVFVDKNENLTASVPTQATVLDLVTVTNPVLASKRWDNRHRFRFLVDKKFSVRGGNTITTINNSSFNQPSILKTFKFHLKLNSMKIKWPNATPNDGEGTNQLYILVLSDQVAAANRNQPQATIATRLLYIDN